MTIARIRTALEGKLATWAAAQSSAIPVAWQNVAFDPPATLYARSFLLPADTNSRDLAGVHREYIGIYQVSLVMPAGEGPGAADALVASLDAAYPTTTYITSGALKVWVTRPFSAGPPQQEDDRYVVPCSMAYRADTYT